MSLPKTDSLPLGDIIKSLANGDFRIPRFQRNYVWKTNEVVDLIDSLLHEYPIGAVILWETKTELSEIKNLGGIEIPKKETGKYTSYIIDGQQRLTSLYFALNGIKTTSGTNCSKLYINLAAEGNESIVVNGLPKNSNPDDYVLLKDLFNTSALFGTHPDKRIKYFQTLTQYTVSIIKLSDDSLGLAEVIDIFERLNLGGKKLNLFSIISANSYVPKSEESSGFDLTDKYESLNKKLKEKYGAIKDSTLLQTIAVCLIGKCNKVAILKELVNIDISKKYSKIEKAMLMAMDHLKTDSYGARIRQLLPSEALLVVYSYFFYKNNLNIVTESQQNYLRDYFWRSIINNCFRSSTDSQINSDLDKINAILKNDIPKQDTVVFAEEHIFSNGAFSLSSSFTKGMLCLMLTKDPKSFSPDRTISIGIDALSSSSQKQYHHFFPKESEAVKFIDAERVNNVVNIVFMDALTNQQISNKNPSVYIEEFSKSNSKLPDILNTHFISIDGFGISTDDYETFIRARGKEMYNNLIGKLVLNEHDIVNNP